MITAQDARSNAECVRHDAVWGSWIDERKQEALAKIKCASLRGAKYITMSSVDWIMCIATNEETGDSYTNQTDFKILIQELEELGYAVELHSHKVVREGIKRTFFEKLFGMKDVPERIRWNPSHVVISWR